MAKPEAVSLKTKDNSRKHPQAREAWIAAKRTGRPKQVCKIITPPVPEGQYFVRPISVWEKV